MLLHLSPSRNITEPWTEFNKTFPYLKVEFYTKTGKDFKKVMLPHTITLKNAGLRKSGSVELKTKMRVAEFESLLKEKFGLNAQVLRRSGKLWLETTHTDNWTLEQQNNHGKELSEPLISKPDREETDYNK